MCGKIQRRRTYTLDEDALNVLFKIKLHTQLEYGDIIDVSLQLTRFICNMMKEDGNTYNGIFENIQKFFESSDADQRTMDDLIVFLKQKEDKTSDVSN